MDYFTLILMSDERSPVRRIQVPKFYLRRVAMGAGVLVLAVAAATWDYWRVRADNSELGGLRVETAEQREQIRTVEQTLQVVRSELERMRELERKVRIIANLPGSAGVGGDEFDGVGDELGERIAPPAGVPVDLTAPEGEVETGPLSHNRSPEPLPLRLGAEPPAGPGLTTSAARRVRALDSFAQQLNSGLGERTESLGLLLDQLDEKRTRLSSMPSVWPARGWLTSRYGYRISPFTGRRHLHSGIDIAGERGTAIVAPARGKVKFAGSKGPLGKTVIVDHGFGVRTYYGHNDELFVKKGDAVVRGQKLAALGSTGRSTGPHLHYVVEVNGKTRNPLDYIID